jgi:hypothetical protein
VHSRIWSGCSSRLFPVVKMESLHELLPDPSPFYFPSLNLFLGRRLDGGRTFRPVEN